MTLTQTVTWIPVEERLPAKTGRYQVAIRSGKVTTRHFYHVDQWGNYNRLVTHWAEPLKHPNELEGKL